MRRLLIPILIVLLACSTLFGQSGQIATYGNGVPTGYCNNARYVDVDTGQAYNCVSNAWQAATLVTFPSKTGNALKVLRVNSGATDYELFTLTSINGLAITASTGTLTITNAKTLSSSNTLTLAGTDSTTMTFPSTSATVARTDAANTFTGHQTIEGVTSTGATGTGKLVFDTTPTLATPVIGVATGTSLAVTGLLTSSGTAGIGYATGAGGTVTQGSNRTTGVTLSKLTGTITTNTTSLAALAAATFTVTNTLVAITDVIVVSIRSGATNVKTDVRVTTVAAGSFNITVHNIDASTAEVGAIIINFVVIKGVIS